MKTEIDLQKYFLCINESEYKLEIDDSINEPFKSLLNDIGILLQTNILIKENEEIRRFKQYSFQNLALTNNGEYINCILSVRDIKDGEYYIQLAKKIALFFNEVFPYEVQNLNIGLPIKNELIFGYELKDYNKNLLYSAGVCLSNELSAIRFTIFKL